MMSWLREVLMLYLRRGVIKLHQTNKLDFSAADNLFPEVFPSKIQRYTSHSYMNTTLLELLEHT